jgi:hypothetical protein
MTGEPAILDAGKRVTWKYSPVLKRVLAGYGRSLER